jgi:hypothetical protein
VVLSRVNYRPGIRCKEPRKGKYERQQLTTNAGSVHTFKREARTGEELNLREQIQNVIRDERTDLEHWAGSR